jgi:hypothetical protein
MERAAQKIVKTPAQVSFFVTRTCTIKDLEYMCNDIIALAGGKEFVLNISKNFKTSQDGRVYCQSEGPALPFRSL